ncbi:MAG TPA: hypothetical protein VGF73_06400, partial [Chthoniobacterales bacterium]
MFAEHAAKISERRDRFLAFRGIARIKEARTTISFPCTSVSRKGKGGAFRVTIQTVNSSGIVSVKRANCLRTDFASA